MPRSLLVTGAASGFGAAAAARLVARGDRVVLVDRDADRGERVAADLGAPFLACDVSDLDEVVAMTERAEGLLGGLDGAILNAGVLTGCGLGADFDVDRYRRANGVNLDGVVFGLHAVIPALRRSGGGSVVCTASMAGLVPAAFDPVYSANKHAVVGLVRSMAPGLAPERIRINAFCPGFAATPIVSSVQDELADSGLPLIPVETAADALVRLVDTADTGLAWSLQAGAELSAFRFRGVPGPRDAAGNPLVLANPAGVRPAPL
jgi:NAD(P)-dependent dehydrogenase (short-subunit alcohol dehydrogenase family)